MKYIISGTNRPRSRTLQVAEVVRSLYAAEGEDVPIIDLAKLSLSEINGAQYGGEGLPLHLQEWIEKINESSGLIVICPEYNGSYPGVLKYFIDHWKYPLSFEHRPVCFVGLGGRFGGVRPVEHLQGVFGYRNSFIFPERVFLSNIFQTLKEGKIVDEMAYQLLKGQCQGFIRFVKALQTAGLSAGHRT